MASYATPEDLAAAQQYGMSIDPGTSGVPMMAPQEVPQVDPYVAAAQQAAAAGYVPAAPQVDTEEAKAAKALMAQMQARQQPLPAQSAPEPAQPAYTGFDPLEDFGRSVIGMGGQSEAPTADTSRLVTGGTLGAQVEPPPVQEPPRQRTGGGMSALGKSKQARDEAQSGFVRATEDLADAAQPSVDTLMARTEKEMELESKSAYLQDRGAELRQISEDAKARTEQIQRDYAEMSKAANEIEVKDRRTTQDRVMGALALALSGVGDAMVNSAGGRADALKTTLGVINQQIERDIDLQREAKRDARQKAADKLTELDIARRMTDDQQQAHKLQTALMMDKYAASIEAIDTRILGAQAQDTAAMTSVELRAQSAQIKAQVAQQKYAETIRAAAAGQPSIKGAMDAEKLRALQLENAAKERDLRGGGGGGGKMDIPGYVRTKDVDTSVVTEASKTEGARASIDASLAELERIRQRNEGKPTWSSADSAAARDIIANIADTRSQLAGGGQAGEAAKQETLDRIPDPTDVALWRDPSAIYRQVRESTNSIARAKLQALGYVPEQSTKPKPVRVIPPGS